MCPPTGQYTFCLYLMCVWTKWFRKTPAVLPTFLYWSLENCCGSRRTTWWYSVFPVCGLSECRWRTTLLEPLDLRFSFIVFLCNKFESVWPISIKRGMTCALNFAALFRLWIYNFKSHFTEERNWIFTFIFCVSTVSSISVDSSDVSIC
jgi:hypothetical protein